MGDNHHRWDQTEVKDRASKALQLKLGGATLQMIVDADIGFTSTSGVSQALKRVLDDEVSTNAQEVIKEEIARCDSMIRTWWPKAKAGDTKAAAVVVKFMDRRSRYLGLDFMDGIMERHVQVQEAQVKMAAELLRRVLSDPELQLSDTQRTIVPTVVNRHLGSVA